MATKKLSLFLLMSTALVPALAAADDILLDPINVTGDVENQHGTVSLSGETLEDLSPREMSDLFAGEASVMSSVIPTGNKTYVNGLDTSMMNVTIDGTLQGDGVFHHATTGMYDPALFKAATIKPGVTAADHGPRANAGSIAYETKDAADLLQEGDYFGGVASLSYDSNSAAFRRDLTLYGRQGAFEYILYGSKATGDDYQDGAGTTYRGSAADLTSFLGKIAYQWDNGYRLEFSGSESQDSGWRQARPNFGDLTTAVFPLFDTKVEQSNYSLTLKNENATGGFSPEFHLGFSSSLLDQGDPVDPSYTRPLWGGEVETWNGKIQNEFLLGNHSLTAGIDFFEQQGTGGAIQGRYTDPALVGGSFGPYSEKTSNVGIFAQMRSELSDVFSLSYGLRADHQNFTGWDGSKLSDDGFSYNISGSYALSDAVTLEAAYSQVWGGFELGETAIINYSYPWVNYAGMQAQETENLRIGLKVNTGNWDASFALFRTDAENIRTRNSADQASASNIVTEGVDAALGYSFASGYLRGTYSYADVTQDGQISTTTNYYAAQPMGHILAIQGAFDVATDWRVGGTAEAALSLDLANVTLPGYEVVNLFAEYKPARVQGLTVRAEINNLFDSYYISRATQGSDNGRVLAYGEPGRSLAVTARLAF
ncbi:TonB-dependent receptor [Phaeobacter sp. G2]|nr:TonB-dependent receptor [Phaeobacter sp. G2]